MHLSQLQIFSKKRDANAVLKGYEFQHLKTLKTWLENRVNNVDEWIYCDFEEDIFQRDLARERIRLRQVKLYSTDFKHDYRGTKILYEYPTLSILDYTDEELDNSPNPFAQLLLIARLSLKERKITEDQLFMAKLQIAKKLKGRGFSEDKVRAIFIFLRNYVRFEDDENYSKFDNELRKDKSSVMNTVEYIKEETLKTVVENLLKRFGFNYPVTEIASMAGVPETLVNDVKKELKSH